MADVNALLPELEAQEKAFLTSIIGNMPDDKARNFAAAYRGQRKDATTILICTLIGFLGVAGIQRFLLNQIGMGILYLLTGGLCYIGTIIDLVKYRELTMEYNRQKAQEIATTL